MLILINPPRPRVAHKSCVRLIVGDLLERANARPGKPHATSFSSRGWLRRTPIPFRSAVLDRCLLEQFNAGTPVYSIGDEPGGMYRRRRRRARNFDGTAANTGPIPRILRCRAPGLGRSPPLRGSPAGSG